MNKIGMAEEDTDWSYSYSPVPTLSSGLEKISPYAHEGTTLLSNSALKSDSVRRSDLRTRLDNDLRARLETDPRSRVSTERRQLNNGGLNYATKERSYQDSGFSEDIDMQMNPVSYLGTTKSGQIYIEPNDETKLTLSHYSQPLVSNSELSTKDRGNPLRGSMKSPPSSPRPSSLKGSRTPSLKGSKCSWRSLAVIFIVLSLTMGATLVFLIASSSLTTEENEAAKACPVVDSSPSIQSNPGLESVLEPRNLPPDGSSFREIKLKDKMAVLVPPFGYLNLQFFHQESRKVSIEVWVPRGSSFALYARRNALPTHTKYNYILLISGSKDRQPRSAGRVQSSENLYLEEGHWFVSLYNDDGEPQPVEILLADSQGAGKLASTADAIDSIRI
ncbi:teneurin-3 [Eurytemora carolleeae]|uniref:teneurin-3 n=1 Tax=Eurytemora carolleeae TaxID=1294199 RepID=UPI000C759712|nr:teneurin-3 [Eurytemora carolleeae]|eukprot:XP_023349165.1 teneurin-3-like [Eurytemora affinis]